MNPSAIALPNQLGELNASLLLHLHDETEQLAMLSPIPCNDVGSATEQMMTVLDAPNEGIELLAAVARGNHYRLSPRFAYGVKELVY